VDKIREFEKGFHQYMGTVGKEILSRIAAKKELDDALEADLTKAILEYKRGTGLVERKEGEEEEEEEDEAGTEAAAEDKSEAKAGE
jgi:hypothetical protein